MNTPAQAWGIRATHGRQTQFVTKQGGEGEGEGEE